LPSRTMDEDTSRVESRYTYRGRLAVMATRRRGARLSSRTMDEDTNWVESRYTYQFEVLTRDYCRWSLSFPIYLRVLRLV